MTAEELLALISSKLDDVLSRLDDLTTLLGHGWTWFTTPAGDFGILARLTFGELLLSLFLVVLVTVKLVHFLYDLLAPRGWW